MPPTTCSPPDHNYATVYRIAFEVIDGRRDRFFDETEVIGTAADREALALLQRSGAVIEWGEHLSVSQPHTALMIFASTELMRPTRTRWSPPEACSPLLTDGSLIPGSAEAVLHHFDLTVNPIGTPPPTVWHGVGPATYDHSEHPGWIPWVADGLTRRTPLAVAYADLFCVSDWRADEFADYVLRRILPEE